MATKQHTKRQIIRSPKYALATALILSILILLKLGTDPSASSVFQKTKKQDKPIIEEQLLTPNAYSRPQNPLTKVKGVVVHYVANAGSSATANRNYFNNLAETKKTYASSHFIIDIDGSIIQCIPLTEISYASNNRNEDTISIEVCHPDETGKFSEESYRSLVSLVAWLAGEYNLSEKDIIRHYDVTGKNCPKYYVENSEAWDFFKKDVFD